MTSLQATLYFHVKKVTLDISNINESGKKDILHKSLNKFLEIAWVDFRSQ